MFLIHIFKLGVSYACLTELVPHVILGLDATIHYLYERYNFLGCPLLFSKTNPGSSGASAGTEILYTQLLGSCEPFQKQDVLNYFVIMHDPNINPGQEFNLSQPGTFCGGGCGIFFSHAEGVAQTVLRKF